MSEPTLLLAPIKPKVVAPRLWIRDRFEVDHWLNISNDDPLPNEGSIIVSLSRWRANCVDLIAIKQSFGIRALPTETIDVASDNANHSPLVALVFLKFTDGRAYSAARHLREAGFKGEIRATGDVLLDQLPLMLRAGFTSFEITDRATIDYLEAGTVPAISRVYQIGSEAAADMWQSRRNISTRSSLAAKSKRAN